MPPGLNRPNLLAFSWFQVWSIGHSRSSAQKCHADVPELRSVLSFPKYANIPILHDGRAALDEGEVLHQWLDTMDFPEFIHLYTQSSLDVESLRLACRFHWRDSFNFHEFNIMWHFFWFLEDENEHWHECWKIKTRTVECGLGLSRVLFRNTADEHDWFVNDMTFD